MLTISKPLSAGQAQNYHAKEFTSKEQNYWSQRGVIQGEWQGQLASRFDLAGAVATEDVLRQEKDISMVACTNCHKLRNASTSCGVCHNIGY